MRYALPGRTPQIHRTAYVAPSADIIGSVALGEYASVWFAAVLRGDNDWIRIGARSNVQDGTVLHVDSGAPLIIGAQVTIGHGTMLHGCHIGDGCLVGIGSRVLNHAQVGEYCIIGANTLLTEGKIFPPRCMIIGSPGKVVRALTDHEIQKLPTYAAIYVEKIARYQNLTSI